MHFGPRQRVADYGRHTGGTFCADIAFLDKALCFA
jgi:hypothetical protein